MLPRTTGQSELMQGVPLPSFQRPPVKETVLGVQFEKLNGLTNAHLGVFWKSLGSAWPSVFDAPSLEQQFEIFEDEPAWAKVGLRLHLTQDPSTRLQIRNASRDRMIQIQNGRLHYNWVGTDGGEYPRYRIIKPEFDQIFGSFAKFLKDNEFDAIRPNQWEVTYVNHILKGTVWADLQDVVDVFNGLLGSTKNPGSTSLESMSGLWHFEIPPRRGRLHVELRHASQPEPARQEMIVMNLTARGPVSEDAAALVTGLDLGRQVIVQAFRDLTSPKAHRIWSIDDDR